jgi:hypothetical protein
MGRSLQPDEKRWAIVTELKAGDDKLYCFDCGLAQYVNIGPFCFNTYKLKSHFGTVVVCEACFRRNETIEKCKEKIKGE